MYLVSMIDYSTPLYSSAKVASACDEPVPTFRARFQKRSSRPPALRVVGRMDGHRTDAAGMPHLFSLRDTMGFAVTLTLMRFGVAPERAFDIGMIHFAHSGNEERSPAELFDVHVRGHTLLICYPESGMFRIVASDDAQTSNDLGIGNQVPNPVVVVIDLNAIEARVFAALGIDPRLGNGKNRAATGGD